MTRIMGIMITDRIKDATELQKVLTEYGCLIKTRLGLHEVSNNTGSKKGLLVLEVIGKKSEWEKFEFAVKSLDGVELKYMDFDL